MDCSTAEVQADRVAPPGEPQKPLSAQPCSRAQVVWCRGGDFWVNTTGNVGMATGGTGDVLSGIIGALWCGG